MRKRGFAKSPEHIAAFPWGRFTIPEIRDNQGRDQWNN